MHKRSLHVWTLGTDTRPRVLLHGSTAVAVLATLVALLATVVVLLALAPNAASAAESTLWLCKPGLASNPCLSSEETTVALGNGATFVRTPRPASDPPVDCFYVYPTVSSELTENADLDIDGEEEAIAVAQASRFSQVCKVYAPIYPQLTIPAITLGAGPTGVAKAYLGVRAAFEEYLAKYNDGRGIVLIGHSQGSAMLIRLIRERIDPNPDLREQLVSAILLGGNVIVPEGKLVGGSFKSIPACRMAWETGCVVAYSSFLREPPNPSFFGRPESPINGLGGGVQGVEHPQVLCVNPTIFFQDGDEGPLLPYYPTSPFPGLLGLVLQVPKAPTPWVSTPGEYDAQCRHVNGASWLQLNYVGPPGDPREKILETLGPLWGTHLVDVNVALGNLIRMVALQSFAFEDGGGFF
jgi:hypothetical protein